MILDGEEHLRFLLKARKYVSASNLATLHKPQIRPGLEYCSYVWGDTAPTAFVLPEAV